METEKLIESGYEYELCQTCSKSLMFDKRHHSPKITFELLDFLHFSTNYHSFEYLLKKKVEIKGKLSDLLCSYTPVMKHLSREAFLS